MIFSFSFYYTNKSALTKVIDKFLDNINMKCIFCVKDDIAFLSVYIYVYIDIHTHTHTHIYSHTDTYTQTHTEASRYVYIHTKLNQ